MTDSRDRLREGIESGDLATVKQIGGTEPTLLHEPLLPSAGRSGYPMTQAAVSGHADILAYLIAKGGDVMETTTFPFAEQQRAVAVLRLWSY